ncbi:MAG: hypothetical protein Q4F54_04010 [Coriobacteriia bacterium]|nr:hypothetical protein [Coriobacteriia bacterium]
MTVTPVEDLIYNGSTQTKDFVVKYKPADADELTLRAEDYTITGNTGKDASDKYSASITGIGNYSGTVTNIV